MVAADCLSSRLSVRTRNHIDRVGHIPVAHMLEWGHIPSDWCSSSDATEGSLTAGNARISPAEHSLGGNLDLVKTDDGDNHSLGHLSVDRHA